MNPSQAQSSFVLHAKPYKETSLWLEIFTKESGRVAAIAKGAKRPKSPVRGLLQSFTPLLITLVGQHDLLTLTSAEMIGAPLRLASKELMAGFYCNELIIKLLHRHDPHPQLFQSYEETVRALSRGEALEETLRRFEFKLIDEIGYGLELLNDADTLESIDPAGSYQWISRHGFVRVNVQSSVAVFLGASLLAIAHGDFSETQTLRDAKGIARLVINDVLGNDRLRTREVGDYFSF